MKLLTLKNTTIMKIKSEKFLKHQSLLLFSQSSGRNTKYLGGCNVSFHCPLEQTKGEIPSILGEVEGKCVFHTCDSDVFIRFNHKVKNNELKPSSFSIGSLIVLVPL